MTLVESTDTLTLEQKASLGSGADFWSTVALPGIPSVAMADGPHGLRQQDITQGADHLGIRPAIKATCFPPAVGLAQTWDRALVARIGAALATEAQAAGVNVLLGPGINIKRDPRGGRNFEYYSEDPILSGELATAWVQGLQGGGVGASLKHFALNNQEHERMRASSDVAPRPLREIYLRAFQRVVQDARPWTVMSSYNRVNGVYASENQWLLTDLLRGEWGFDGIVVSDWGAVSDRVASVRAGLDLEMPAGDGENDRMVTDAVRRGDLEESVLDTSVARMELLARRAADGARPGTTWSIDEHHALAREVATRAIVLLKNDDALLPLAADQRIAVIGELGEHARFQGGGSSHVNTTRVDVPVDEIRAVATGDVTFARGYTTDAAEPTEALRADAVRAAAAADVAVLFLGLGERQESEGFDRDDIELPADQRELLAAVRAVQPRTVVVLMHGGVLELAPIMGDAAAILDAGLLGQAAGGAVADVLFGSVNPSGRLAETVPLRLQDAPAYDDFPGESLHIRYGEGLFVGYRWYDRRGFDVAFPFGHGLSYTTFTYADAVARAEGDAVVVEVRVTNTGAVRGREIVQVYTARPGSDVVRPEQELKGFVPIDLEPGASAIATVRIDRADLAYWHERAERWVVEGGDYEIRIGASSRDIRAVVQAEVAGDDVAMELTLESTVAEVMANPYAAERFGTAIAAVFGQASEGTAADSGVDMVRMIGSFPIGRFVSSLGGQITKSDLAGILDAANAAARR